ncbi:MAG: 6-bladed beta-propeller [Prevotellaceae bacterium]|jgi:hypothetical protein|nr:6-bladed beta-propeller [Prevotellaceae bacterium]
MKNLLCITACFSLLIVIISCNRTREKHIRNNYETDKIVVDINREDKSSFDDFFEYSHHIVLQTTDNSLISRIDKMQIRNDRLYILDRTGVILVFDTNGNFIKRINHKGQSGMEYISAHDFEIDTEDNLYICDFLGSKILKYDKNDEFITAIKLPVKSPSFKLMGKDCYAFDLRNGANTSGEKTFFNYLYYKNGYITCKALPFNPNLQGHSFSYGYGLSSFYLYNKKTFLTSTMNDTVYTINENGFPIPFAIYEFGLKKPELSFSKEEIEQYLREQQRGNKISGIYCFYLFNDFLFICFDYRGQTNYVISKINESPLFIGKFGYDKNGLCIIPIAYLSDFRQPQLATIIDPDYLSSLLKKRKATDNSDLLLSMQKSVVEEDNPILVFYNWK